MGYKIGYSLSTMTNLLQKIETEDIFNTGAWKMDSSSASPVYVNNLCTDEYLGNWIIEYASQVPAALAGIRPIFLTVYKVGTNLYQMIFYKDRVWIRRNDSGTTWNAWAEALSPDSVDYTDTEPLSPGAWALWFDTSGDKPVIKTYDQVNARWVIVQPANLMKVSVYDTSGKATDYFGYVDGKITSEGLDTAHTNFAAHIANSSLHITATERQNWDAAADQEDMESMVDAAEAEVEATVSSKVSNAHSATTTQDTNVTNYQSTLDSHEANTTIHPSTTIQEDWASRAEGNHTHILDGRVAVVAANVVSGVVPISTIPAAALERSKTVSTNTDRLALTTSDVQTGDWVYVTNGTKGFETYAVVDQTKLGTEAAFIRFNQDVVDLIWSNIQNKPTTLAGYGITNAYTKTEINNTVISPYVTASSNLVLDTAALKSKVDDIAISSSTFTSITSSQATVDDSTDEIATLLNNIGAQF